MEVCKAKEFIYNPVSIHSENKLYISKDLDKILEKTDGELISVYAILETPEGLVLFDMDFTYAGEPIILRKFMHKDSYLGFYSHKEIITL